MGLVAQVGIRSRVEGGDRHSLLLRELDRLTQVVDAGAVHLVVGGQQDGAGALLVVMVESHDARGQTIANERRDLLVLVQDRLQVLEEFPCSRYLSANLDEAGVDRVRHVLEDVGGHVVVVGEREHRHRVGVPQLQRDPLPLEVGDDLPEGPADLRVVGQHRSGRVQAQDDVAARRLVVLDVAVDGRARRHGGRDDGDQEADEGHSQRSARATHERLVLRQAPQVAGVGHPPLLSRAHAGATREHPADDRRDHDDREDDGD